MEKHQPTTTDSSIANVTIDREACPKSWYILQVQVKCEKRIAQRISKLGFETYVPTQIELRQWSDRKKLVERLLIPLIVFVKATLKEAREIEKLTFVYSLMRAPGCYTPAVVPDYQMEQLKFMVGNSESPVTIEAKDVSKGDKVEVIRGKLCGLVGEVLTLPDGRHKLSITIDCLGCATVELPLTDLKLLSP